MALDGTSLPIDGYYSPRKEPLRFHAEILQELVERTIGHRTHEFQVLLLGKFGIPSRVVDIGTGGKDRIVFSQRDVPGIKEKIDPYLQQGLEIIGDYHNHTTSTVDEYMSNGYDPVTSITPSSSDIGTSYNVFQQAFGVSWPRIIGAFIPENGKVAISAFDILRVVEDSTALHDFEFKSKELPFPPPTRFTKLGIRKHRAILSDPVKMINGLYIRPRQILLPEPHRLPVFINAIQETYGSKLIGK